MCALLAHAGVVGWPTPCSRLPGRRGGPDRSQCAPTPPIARVEARRRITIAGLHPPVARNATGIWRSGGQGPGVRDELLAPAVPATGRSGRSFTVGKSMNSAGSTPMGRTSGLDRYMDMIVCLPMASSGLGNSAAWADSCALICALVTRSREARPPAGGTSAVECRGSRRARWARPCLPGRRGGRPHRGVTSRRAPRDSRPL